MQAYHEMLVDVMNNGADSDDRTGVGTRRVFGRQFRTSLEPFPIVTTKNIHFRSIYFELMWMLLGYNEVPWLRKRGVTIWDEWANEKGDIGPGYGVQWRQFASEYSPDGRDGWGANVTDQIGMLLKDLKQNPNSRRHIVTAWNPMMTDQMALPPCHLLFQVGIIGNRLNLHMYQRSADLFLGVPFNITQYALLAHILCWLTGYLPGELIISYGDLHIYRNHFDQVTEQLGRSTSLYERHNIRVPYSIAQIYEMGDRAPTLDDFDVSPEYKPKEDMLPWYRAYPSIKAEVAV